jgi:Tol biopolymer transport system component
VAQLTHLQTTPGSLKWSPDGKTLVFTMFIQDSSPILSVKLPKKPSGANWASPGIVIDRLSWQSDGRGPVPKGYSHIYSLDAELGGTPRKLTSGDYSHSDPQWSADGKTIYFSAIRKPEAEYQNGDSEIYSLDLDSLEITALTDRKGPDRGMRVSPDGKWIVYTGNDDKNYTSHLSSLYFMDSSGGKKRLLAGDLPNSPSSVTWAKDSSGVYFIMSEKGVANYYFASRNGNIKMISEGNHYFSGLSLAKNNQVAATLSDYYNPGTLVTFNLNSPTDIKTLVDVNTDILADIKLGEVEEMWFKSPDGLDLQGAGI